MLSAQRTCQIIVLITYHDCARHTNWADISDSAHCSKQYNKNYEFVTKVWFIEI